jgi:hypothetical protein
MIIVHTLPGIRSHSSGHPESFRWPIISNRTVFRQSQLIDTFIPASQMGEKAVLFSSFASTPAAGAADLGTAIRGGFVSDD